MFSQRTLGSIPSFGGDVQGSTSSSSSSSSRRGHSTLHRINGAAPTDGVSIAAGSFLTVARNGIIALLSQHPPHSLVHAVTTRYAHVLQLLYLPSIRTLVALEEMNMTAQLAAEARQPQRRVVLYRIFEVDTGRNKPHSDCDNAADAIMPTQARDTAKFEVQFTELLEEGQDPNALNTPSVECIAVCDRSLRVAAAYGNSIMIWDCSGLCEPVTAHPHARMRQSASVVQVLGYPKLLFSLTTTLHIQQLALCQSWLAYSSMHEMRLINISSSDDAGVQVPTQAARSQNINPMRFTTSSGVDIVHPFVATPVETLFDETDSVKLQQRSQRVHVEWILDEFGNPTLVDHATSMIAPATVQRHNAELAATAQQAEDGKENITARQAKRAGTRYRKRQYAFEAIGNRPDATHIIRYGTSARCHITAIHLLIHRRFLSSDQIRSLGFLEGSTAAANSRTLPARFFISTLQQGFIYDMQRLMTLPESQWTGFGEQKQRTAAYPVSPSERDAAPLIATYSYQDDVVDLEWNPPLLFALTRQGVEVYGIWSKSSIACHFRSPKLLWFEPLYTSNTQNRTWSSVVVCGGRLVVTASRILESSSHRPSLELSCTADGKVVAGALDSGLGRLDFEHRLAVGASKSSRSPNESSYDNSKSETVILVPIRQADLMSMEYLGPLQLSRLLLKLVGLHISNETLPLSVPHMSPASSPPISSVSFPPLAATSQRMFSCAAEAYEVLRGRLAQLNSSADATPSQVIECANLQRSMDKLCGLIGDVLLQQLLAAEKPQYLMSDGSENVHSTSTVLQPLIRLAMQLYSQCSRPPSAVVVHLQSFIANASQRHTRSLVDIESTQDFSNQFDPTHERLRALMLTEYFESMLAHPQPAAHRDILSNAKLGEAIIEHFAIHNPQGLSMKLMESSLFWAPADTRRTIQHLTGALAKHAQLMNQKSHAHSRPHRHAHSGRHRHKQAQHLLLSSPNATANPDDLDWNMLTPVDLLAFAMLYLRLGDIGKAQVWVQRLGLEPLESFVSLDSRLLTSWSHRLSLIQFLRVHTPWSLVRILIHLTLQRQEPSEDTAHNSFGVGQSLDILRASARFADDVKVDLKQESNGIAVHNSDDTDLQQLLRVLDQDWIAVGSDLDTVELTEAYLIGVCRELQHQDTSPDLCHICSQLLRKIAVTHLQSCLELAQQSGDFNDPPASSALPSDLDALKEDARDDFLSALPIAQRAPKWYADIHVTLNSSSNHGDMWKSKSMKVVLDRIQCVEDALLLCTRSTQSSSSSTITMSSSRESASNRLAAFLEQVCTTSTIPSRVSERLLLVRILLAAYCPEPCSTDNNVGIRRALSLLCGVHSNCLSAFVQQYCKSSGPLLQQAFTFVLERMRECNDVKLSTHLMETLAWLLDTMVEHLPTTQFVTLLPADGDMSFFLPYIQRSFTLNRLETTGWPVL
jgi:hypothetical protein